MLRIALTRQIPGNKLIFIGMFLITCGLTFIVALQSVNQIYSTSKNMTTVEAKFGKWANRPNPYDNGCMSNWEEVCGSRRFWFLWPFPIPIPKVQDGFGYPRCPDAEDTPFMASAPPGIF
jgi:hypothetical protein